MTTYRVCRQFTYRDAEYQPGDTVTSEELAWPQREAQLVRHRVLAEILPAHEAWIPEPVPLPAGEAVSPFSGMATIMQSADKPIAALDVTSADVPSLKGTRPVGRPKRR